MPECTPKARASYEAVATTCRGRRGSPFPPTTTGSPASSGRRSTSTAARNWSRSTCSTQYRCSPTRPVCPPGSGPSDQPDDLGGHPQLADAGRVERRRVAHALQVGAQAVARGVAEQLELRVGHGEAVLLGAGAQHVVEPVVARGQQLDLGLVQAGIAVRAGVGAAGLWPERAV